MAETSACSLCGAQDSWRYSLIECNVARCVWALAKEELLEHMVRSTGPSARQWMFLMLETLSKEEFAIMAVTLWAIWFARRKIIFDGEFQSPLTTHGFVENYMRDLAIVYPSATKGTPGVRSSHPRWIAPPKGFAKFNVDAAVAKNITGGALAVVCRSAGGVFLGASALVVAGISDPATLEALACREALALAEDLNIQKMVVASDCLQVINNIHGDFRGSYSMVTREINAKSSSFSDVRFRHENRASNSEAHRVARSFVSSITGRQLPRAALATVSCSSDCNTARSASMPIVKCAQHGQRGHGIAAIDLGSSSCTAPDARTRPCARALARDKACVTPAREPAPVSWPVGRATRTADFRARCARPAAATEAA
ncbi:hypothetical protein QYE76_018047 [Lolium multiflorum]|uniref:RNase H type-1 domain-containing protein n=1 Tax=Lolium multiflorum TaxID=4521 RepID=A0AAD8QKN5_LOLMU|nr:hypothetical protein QYE76_018047 [Lolium multiflorum]